MAQPYYQSVWHCKLCGEDNRWSLSCILSGEAIRCGTCTQFALAPEGAGIVKAILNAPKAAEQQRRRAIEEVRDDMRQNQHLIMKKYDALKQALAKWRQIENALRGDIDELTIEQNKINNILTVKQKKLESDPGLNSNVKLRERLEHLFDIMLKDPAEFTHCNDADAASM